MRGCLAAVMIIVCLFFALVVGLGLTVLVFRGYAAGVTYGPYGRPATAVESGEQVEITPQHSQPVPQYSQRVVRDGTSWRVVSLLVFSLVLGAIVLLAVLGGICRNSGTRSHCEQLRSAERMNTIEELRAGIDRMTRRVESLETILGGRARR
jgi:hypothetical protein